MSNTLTTAPAYVYATRDDVADLLSAEGVVLRMDDDQSGTMDAGEAARLDRAIWQSTDEVNLYLSSYDPVDLSANGMVNRWTVILTAYWLCHRRSEGPSDGMQKLYDKAMEQLEAVKAGRLSLADAARRESEWPVWSNVHRSLRYTYRQLRVERPISERSRATAPQSVDWEAEQGAPYEVW